MNRQQNQKKPSKWWMELPAAAGLFAVVCIIASGKTAHMTQHQKASMFGALLAAALVLMVVLKIVDSAFRRSRSGGNSRQVQRRPAGGRWQ
jgi:hypothetical protein